jgi:hypothetical protein
MSNLSRGMTVYTLDQQPLGTIVTVGEEAFSVVRPGEPPFWIQLSDVYTIDINRVTLLFNATRAGVHIDGASRFR